MWTHVRSILACCSCGFGLSEVGVREIRKPQVAGSIPVAGSRSRSDLEPHQVLREQGRSLIHS